MLPRDQRQRSYSIGHWFQEGVGCNADLRRGSDELREPKKPRRTFPGHQVRDVVNGKRDVEYGGGQAAQSVRHHSTGASLVRSRRLGRDDTEDQHSCCRRRP